MFSRSLLKVNRGVRCLSTPSNFKNVAVVGLGLMGHGIVQIAATNGFNVTAVELNDKALETGMNRINSSLDKIIARDLKTGKITPEEGEKKKKDILSKIKTSTDLNELQDQDIIIEAIIEKEDIKIDFYKNLGKIVKNKDTIFASNTSSLAITNMALASGRPEKFVGLHFFNPVQVMKLVEIVSTEHTDPAISKKIYAFTEELKKSPVECVDTPGFIVNRLLIPFLAQAMALYDRKHGSIKDIDLAMKLGAGHPMGPFVLADYVGLDTLYNALVGWKENFPDEPAFLIPESLKKKVEAGDLGRKTGKGFYTWNGDVPLEPVE